MASTRPTARTQSSSGFAPGPHAMECVFLPCTSPRSASDKDRGGSSWGLLAEGQFSIHCESFPGVPHRHFVHPLLLFCSSQHLFVSKVSSAAPLVTRLTKQSSSDTRLTKACKGRQGFKLDFVRFRSIFGHLLGHCSRMPTAELRFQPAAAAGTGGQ